MADFTLFADDLFTEEPSPARPVRLVSTGLADTAEVPTSTKPAPPPAYAPCPACGHLVLSGIATSGVQLALDVDVRTYAPDWDHGAALPRLHESRGYPVHRCGALSERVEQRLTP